MKYLKRMSVFLIIFYSCALAQIPGLNFDGKIILRINGHEHLLPNDILGEFDKT